MKHVYLLTSTNPGNQYEMPYVELAALKAFTSEDAAKRYQKRGGDPKSMEALDTAEITKVTLHG